MNFNSSQKCPPLTHIANYISYLVLDMVMENKTSPG